MYTQEQVCRCLSLPDNTSKTKLKREAKRRRIHCRELACAIDESREARSNTVIGAGYKPMSTKKAKTMGLDWVLIRIRFKT